LGTIVIIQNCAHEEVNATIRFRIFCLPVSFALSNRPTDENHISSLNLVRKLHGQFNGSRPVTGGAFLHKRKKNTALAYFANPAKVHKFQVPVSELLS
jgi:hypothetical protein